MHFQHFSSAKDQALPYLFLILLKPILCSFCKAHLKPNFCAAQGQQKIGLLPNNFLPVSCDPSILVVPESYTLWGVLLLLDCLLACLRPLFSSFSFSSRGFWTFLGQRDVLDDQPHDVLVGDNLAHVDAGMLLTSQLHLSLARPLLPPHVPD